MSEDEAVLAIVQFIRAHYGHDMPEAAIAEETGLTVEQVRQVFAHRLQAVSKGYFRIGLNARKATIADAFGPPK